MPKIDPDAFRAEQRRIQLAAQDYLLRSIQTNDVNGVMASLTELNRNGGCRKAYRLVARRLKGAAVGPEVARHFLDLWLNDSYPLLDDVGDDAIVGDVLRVVLPRYTGPSLTLYRGDSAFNRRRGSYGFSWSANVEVAEQFAAGIWRMSEGGSVLLQADAPAEAIICAPALFANDYDELEYIVDRRQLRSVQVLKRYCQLPQEPFVHLGSDLDKAPTE